MNRADLERVVDEEFVRGRPRVSHTMGLRSGADVYVYQYDNPRLPLGVVRTYAVVPGSQGGCMMLTPNRPEHVDASDVVGHSYVEHTFVENEPEEYRARQLLVCDDFRRRGVASDMYDAAELAIGQSIVGDESISGAGRAFRRATGRSE